MTSEAERFTSGMRGFASGMRGGNAMRADSPYNGEPPGFSGVTPALDGLHRNVRAVKGLRRGARLIPRAVLSRLSFGG